MKVRRHKNARTTPALRLEIQHSPLSERALAKKCNLSRMTVRKWKKRETVEDASHRPHQLHTTLNGAREAIVVYVRRTLLLALDDLLVLTREFLPPRVSRSGLDRCLRRHGVSNLKQLIAAQQPEQAPAPKKTFKDYEPGYVHVDVKYLPQLDERGRRYLFVAIDRAGRWVYLDTLVDKRAASACAFLKRLVAKAPFVIRTVLTDNGKRRGKNPDPISFVNVSMIARDLTVVEIPVDRLPGTKLRRHHPPLTAAFNNVQNPIEHLTPIRGRTPRLACSAVGFR